MFTGIIHYPGRVTANVLTKNGMTFSVHCPRALVRRVKNGSSVAVDGVCLTVVGKKGGEVVFDVMPETATRTTLATLRPGDRVNCEPALRVGDELGGHIVQGHVDGVGTVQFRRHVKNATILGVAIPKDLVPSVVPQGSIAIDGVSLTVVSIRKNVVTVSLIPYTLAHTTLDALSVGSRVNIEVDVLAKYARKKI
ncbi:MAG: riboflavin synthase [Candidatus Kerfeldbacteria bacterium]|nr:riboflavin synthase [Candidatus Kerfeldbacteria bacterium]